MRSKAEREGGREAEGERESEGRVGRRERKHTHFPFVCRFFTG